MMELFQTLFDWYMANLNYFTVALLMAIESTFIPLPSEVVVPFAAYKAAQGDLNVFLVVFFGTVGALSGSLINYSLAYYLGRPLVHKFAASKVGRLFLLSEEKVIQSNISLETARHQLLSDVLCQVCVILYLFLPALQR
jgi:membrane protein DedA with SNARE-associated domain